MIMVNRCILIFKHVNDSHSRKHKGRLPAYDLHVNNYLVRSYGFVIVVATRSVIRRAIKAKIGNNGDAIVINYCMLYAKHYIYLEILKKTETKMDLIWTSLGTCSISNIY